MKWRSVASLALSRTRSVLSISGGTVFVVVFPAFYLIRQGLPSWIAHNAVVPPSEFALSKKS